MEELQKASHYRSFYDVAKKLTDPKDRLCFYDALDSYRFEGVIPEDLTPTVDLLLTCLLPILDADLKRKKGGAPKGNGNARKRKAEENEPEEVEPKETKETEEEIKDEPKEKKRRFAKPTVEEIKAYCDERSNQVDPQRFFDYYESKGWLIGKTPMKDWRASVRTWEQKEDVKPKTEYNPLPEGRLMF